jgi:hypothetical protein
MIKPEEVEEYAKQKENENLRFRTFLKNHADETKLDEQFAINGGDFMDLPGFL